MTDPIPPHVEFAHAFFTPENIARILSQPGAQDYINAPVYTGPTDEAPTQ